MTRETSREAYHKIKDQGLLSQKRWQVYDILFAIGPATGSQVASEYRKRYGRTSNSETVRNRLTELRDAEVVKEVGRTNDQHTGMSVLQWDVTSKLPIKLIRNKKPKQMCLICGGKGWVDERQC